MVRLGLLIESENVPPWVVEIIDILNHNKNVELVSLVSFKDQGSKTELTHQDFHLPERIPFITSVVISDSGKVTFDANTINSVVAYSHDLLLYFSSKIPTGINDLSKYGTWSVCFGEKSQLCETSPVFWDCFHNKRHTKISVIRLTRRISEGEVVQELNVSTNRLSFSKNLAKVISKAVALLTDEVLKLASGSEGSDDVLKLGKSITITNDTRKPNFRSVLVGYLKVNSRSLIKRLKELIFNKDWVIFYDLKSTQTPSLDFRKFKALIPPRGFFWADPFVISRDSQHYIFLEEFQWSTNKGHISCLILDCKGKKIMSKKILDKPYHLSYPFVFSHRETYYMIPESSENRTIDIYECVNFPFEWTWKQTLISNIDAVDTTIHYCDEQYWLFCGVKSNKNSNVYDDLNIYYSNDLFGGSWKAHPKNPVVSDIKSARPAGKVYSQEGILYRPSQIGVPFYGYGLAINRITELNEKNYKEEGHLTITPNWRKRLGSNHTLNSSEKITVTDGVLSWFRIG